MREIFWEFSCPLFLLSPLVPYSIPAPSSINFSTSDSVVAFIFVIQLKIVFFQSIVTHLSDMPLKRQSSLIYCIFSIIYRSSYFLIDHHVPAFLLQSREFFLTLFFSSSLVVRFCLSFQHHTFCTAEPFWLDKRRVIFLRFRRLLTYCMLFFTMEARAEDPKSCFARLFCNLSGLLFVLW